MKFLKSLILPLALVCTASAIDQDDIRRFRWVWDPGDMVYLPAPYDYSPPKSGGVNVKGIEAFNPSTGKFESLTLGTGVLIDFTAKTVSLDLVTIAASTEIQAAIAASASAPSFSAPARSLNTSFRPSTTRNALVSYSVDIACSATLVGGQTGTVFLEYADDSGFTTNVVEVGRFVNGNSVSLAIAITVNQTNTGTLTGMIPANKYVRLRTANTVGTPTFNYRSGQEVLL